MEVDIDLLIKELRASSTSAEKYLQIQKLANIGSMVGGIAHRFNNVLGGILGYAQLLKEDLAPESEGYEKAAVIESAARKASKLILQLHLFSNEKQLRPRPVDPKEVVNEIVKIAESAFTPNIQIETAFEHGTHFVLADFQSLSLMLLNTFLNARDAMPSGGLLQLNTHLREVDAQPRVLFEIRDRGHGIPSDDLTKVFDPFFSRKRDSTASGFGLTITKQLVEAQKGGIEIESVEGKGTTVRFWLPTVQTTSPVLNTSHSPLRISQEGDWVLVVEDEQELRELAQSIFERKGFKVLLADSGENAIKLFNENAEKIKLVILDMILPGPNGNQVYREIKRNRSQPKIILTSGLSKDSSALEIEEDENDVFVPKPWDLPELLSSVNRLLQAGSN